AGVSAFKMECCPPSPWNGVRDDGGTLSAISMEPCPPSRGIRMAPISMIAAPATEPEAGSSERLLSGDVPKVIITNFE
ncbi:hypothetical protein ACFPP7_17140, partial [Polaromonas jejuensis]